MIAPFRGVAPSIAASAFIADSAVVIGDVVIGADTSLWFHAVVRGDVFPIRIGRGTNVQDHATLHVLSGRAATTVGDDVTIGHGAIVHGCTIEDQCLIGMGAILLNGATVGSGSIVAAGTLLVEGAKIPPRSLVMGSPGKVKRTLSDEEVADIQAYADRYVGYRLDYMNNAID